MKNKIVFISDNQIIKIHSFVNESAANHQNKGRDIQQKEFDIILGKGGEFAYKNLYDQNHSTPCSEIKTENKKFGDGGKDIDNLNIDVKTLGDDPEWKEKRLTYKEKRRVYLGFSIGHKPTCESWVLMRKINEKQFQYIGRVFLKDLQNSDFHIDSYNQNAIYLDKKLFEDSKF